MGTKRPRDTTAKASLNEPERSFEEAVVNFILLEEVEPGQGCWLQHIHSQAFQHPGKPTGTKSQKELFSMLDAMPSLVKKEDDGKISFAVRDSSAASSDANHGRPSTANGALEPVATAIDLVQSAIDNLNYALDYHDEIGDEYVTTSRKNVVVPFERWQKLRQYIIDARARLT